MSSTSQYAAKGKGKYSSPETVWQEWEWNSAGYWESRRINASGAIEYRRDPPLNQPAGNATTPRSAGVFGDLYAVNSGCIPISTSEEHYSGLQAATHDYLTSKGFTDSGESYVVPHAATYYPNWSTSADSGGYGQNLSNTYGQSPTGGDYPQASSIYSAPAYHDSPANSNAHLSYPGPQEQDYLDAAASAFSGLSLADPKIIRREPGSQDYESLDPRYCVVPLKDSKWFWKFGRVFMMLWTEPGGPQVSAGGGTNKNGSLISTTWLNESEYSEIRRFVVVKEGHDYVQCLAVHTYSNRATLKPNLPDRHQHAIIYTSRQCPEELSEVTGVGQVYSEDLVLDPIRVTSEQKGPEGTLSPCSRIQFSKIYSVGKDTRVLNIGMVSRESLPSLELNSPLKQKWNSQTSKRGRSDYRRRKGNSRTDKSPSRRRYEMDIDYPIKTPKGSDSEPTFYRESNVGIGSSSGKLNDPMDTVQRSTGLADSLAGYQIIGFPSRFFKKGRVFKALWTEPAGDVTNTEDAFVIPSRYGENAFTKIRHFVVAREKQGCCLCLMLNTYHRQGASKDGIKAENYAAVYPLGGEPEVGPNENMTKEPFPIKVEEAGESIDPTSRIDFGRVYTVEHNIKVLKVGRIPNDFLPRLEEYFVNSIVGP